MNKIPVLKQAILNDKIWKDESLSKERYGIAIVGRISCGEFEIGECELEGYLEIPKSFLGSGEYFALRAKGNSMVDAGICENDIVIIRINPSPDDGCIAAIRDGDQMILKRFYRLAETQQYLLHPENPDYHDIVTNNCDVLDVAVKVVKDI